MKSSSASSKRFMQIQLALGNYPVISGRIRERMRHEMFTRGILQAEAFEDEIKEMAIHSQAREGITNPTTQEAPEIWNLRIERIQEHLTDLRFSQNLSFAIFERVVNDVLSKRGISVDDLMYTINLELAPMELVFEYATTIERLSPEDRVKHEPRLEQAKVVLIRYLISDQLPYINIAKEWLTIDDLAAIRAHKIGPGRVGGKAAGLLLAARILSSTNAEMACRLKTPESYFIGSAVLYTFMSVNELMHWNNQKYKSEVEMRAEYPQIVSEFENGDLREEMKNKLTDMLNNIGNKPLIVRSSSLLEDNFGTSFAGKYESVYLPNQGTLQENLIALIKGMARIYASTLNPAALLYRRSKGLQNYDERMAILVQVVEGERFGDYYFPFLAGVGFSHNQYRWTPQIRREDGLVRMVWGLGTRAVDRVGNDYPRMVALSHPALRPSTDTKTIRRYSQQYIDLIDLKSNSFKTLPVKEVINGKYPYLRYLVQRDEGGYFTSLRSNLFQGDTSTLVMTFDDVLNRTTFAEMMRLILKTLEEHYRFPVDIEFTVDLIREEDGKTSPCITLLQCRPQSHFESESHPPLPKKLSQNRKIFSTNFMVPEGYVERADYVVFVEPEEYFALQTPSSRHELARYVSKLNTALEDESFILIGPGRWGSSNSDLGVPIDYGDIYHSRALVELTGEGLGLAPEPSLGTHFFQDLMEAHICPLAIYLDDPKTVFNRKFFYETRNRLDEFVDIPEKLRPCLRVIRVSDYQARSFLRIILEEEKSYAVAFLMRDEE
jgi:hypothetical protein